MNSELTKKIKEADWVALLQAGFQQIAEKPELFKADAAGATGIYLVAAGVAKLLREHLAAVTFRETLRPTIDGIVKENRENAERLAAFHKRLDELESELDQLDKGISLPIVRMGGVEKHAAVGGGLDEQDIGTLRRAAERENDPTSRRALKNAADVADVKRALRGGDQK